MYQPSPSFRHFLHSPNPQMPENCNSRSLSWLVNSCIPKSPSDLHIHTQTPPASTEPVPSPIDSLPDDLLLACLSRAPISSLPAVSSTSRRFSLLLSSPLFFSLRRSLSLTSCSLLCVSLFSTNLSIALLQSDLATWHLSSFPLSAPLSHFCSLSIDNAVFIISSRSAIKFDTWTARFSPISPPSVPRKKFAVAVIAGKIYIAGGSARTSAVEAYDPAADKWTVVAHSTSRRYGCVGASAGEFLYVVGGIKIGGACAAHVTAGTMDAYHVRSGAWAVRGSRAVPGGGCVVGACGVGPSLYVVASNAVEFTFWRWDWENENDKRRGDWVRLVGPPVRQRLGFGAAVRFSCCAGPGEGKMAAAVHVRGRGRNGDFDDGMILVYDVRSGEWSRGPELPVGFWRAGLVRVEH